MISRRVLRTFRRRHFGLKEGLVILFIFAFYFWRQKSSSPLNTGERVDDSLRGDPANGYQNDEDEEKGVGLQEEEKDDERSPIRDYILEKNDEKEVEEEYKLEGFEKVKRTLGIEVEEDQDDEKDYEEHVRDILRVKDSLLNRKSKQNALSKLKEVVGRPLADPDYDPELIDDPHDDPVINDLEEVERQERKIVANNKKGKLDERKQNIKFKPMDDEIGEIGRDLPDVRSNECKFKSYPEVLPTASVIIVFYDEGLKTLLRTVHSIIDRSPTHLISEIILIDDASTKEHYTKELKVQLHQIDYPIIIRRTKQRFGWVLARIQGAEYAKGDILIFLDAHTEVTKGWLEPILSRISDNRNTVVFPIIDHIEPKTLKYISESEHFIKVGVFDWSLSVTWQNKLTHGHDPTSPTPSPVMADAVFAIDRDYFAVLGGYDSFYTTEDTADLDLSFKIWMCGGSIELLPCSHVGHLHKANLPFQLEGRGEINDKKRLAEIWFGEYKTFFYTIFPHAKDENPGDLREEEATIKKLKCKTIYWYWEIVYPDSIWPVHGERYGELRHKESDKCLDVAIEEKNHQIQNVVASVIVCDGAGTNQIWMLTSIGEIRNNFLCLESFDGITVTASKCHKQKSTQEWMFDFSTDRIYHAVSEHCLHIEVDGHVMLKECAPSKAQSWKLASRT